MTLFLTHVLKWEYEAIALISLFGSIYFADKDIAIEGLVFFSREGKNTVTKIMMGTKAKTK